MLSSWKAPGVHGIPAEIITSGKADLLQSAVMVYLRYCQKWMPTKIPSLIGVSRGYYEGIRGTVQYDGDISKEFEVKHCCILAPIFFGVFFALLMKHTSKSSVGGVYLHSRSVCSTCQNPKQKTI
jgi:hypothetical protein